MPTEGSKNLVREGEKKGVKKMKRYFKSYFKFLARLGGVIFLLTFLLGAVDFLTLIVESPLPRGVDWAAIAAYILLILTFLLYTPK